MTTNLQKVYCLILGEVNMNSITKQEAVAIQSITLKDEERQVCEVWTRVMGYHRPMSSFNIGKKGEFHERTYFKESPQLSTN